MPSGPILVDLGFFFFNFKEFWYDAKAAGWNWNGSSLGGLEAWGRWVIAGGKMEAGEEKWEERREEMGELEDCREWRSVNGGGKLFLP